MHPSLEQKRHLRQRMRSNRQALNQEHQSIAAESLLTRLKSMTVFNCANSIALYLASDGEIDPIAVIKYCWGQGKKLYLPVLDPDHHNQLLFIYYTKDTPMCLNKYRIREPAAPYQNLLDANQLDLVLLPLVAFDDRGSRMGMGGGYYDRSFAFKAQRQSTKPELIGLAHEMQKVEALSVESWDVPLSTIVTDMNIYLGHIAAT